MTFFWVLQAKSVFQVKLCTCWWTSESTCLASNSDGLPRLVKFLPPGLGHRWGPTLGMETLLLSLVYSSSMEKRTNIECAPVIFLLGNMIDAHRLFEQSYKILFFPFYRSGNWGPEKGRSFSKVTPVKRGRAGLSTRNIRPQKYFSSYRSASQILSFMCYIWVLLSSEKWELRRAGFFGISSHSFLSLGLGLPCEKEITGNVAVKNASWTTHLISLTSKTKEISNKRLLLRSICTKTGRPGGCGSWKANGQVTAYLVDPRKDNMGHSQGKPASTLVYTDHWQKPWELETADVPGSASEVTKASNKED